jgi:hypothetical protein
MFFEPFVPFWFAQLKQHWMFHRSAHKSQFFPKLVWDLSVISFWVCIRLWKPTSHAAGPPSLVESDGDLPDVLPVAMFDGQLFNRLPSEPVQACYLSSSGCSLFGEACCWMLPSCFGQSDGIRSGPAHREKIMRHPLMGFERNKLLQ